MITVKLKNYRSFSLNCPIEIELKGGITFILGVNNVGKSNILRFFHEMRQVFAHFASSNQTPHSFNFDRSFDSVRSQANRRNEIWLEVGDEHGSAKLIVRPNSQDAGSQGAAVELVGGPSGDFGRLKPTFLQLANALYIGPIRSQLAQSHVSNNMIGGSNLVSHWDDWANGESVEKRSAMRLLTNELREIFGFSTFSIRISKQRDTLLITTDDGDFKLQELGDGISHFITVLANMVFRPPSMVLIDEPENGLHPRMQEALIRAIAARTSGVLATSHSVGLARSVADEILMMSRSGQERRLSPFGEHYSPSISQTISELGYSQFAELGGNHLLLVEGRTEIKSFREILRKLHAEQHFLIWSLGGAEFISSNEDRICEELNDLKRLNCRSISVVFDSERTAPDQPLSEKFQRFADLCSKLGFQVLATGRHSTENYISPSAIEKVLGPGIPALGPHDVFGVGATKWPKFKNWLLFREMSSEELQETDLWQFLELLAKKVDR